MQLTRYLRDHFAPADPARRRLRMDQLALSAKNALHSSMTYPVSVPLLGLAATHWAPLPLVALWVSSVLSIVCVLHYFARQVEFDTENLDSLPHHGMMMTICSAAFVICFGGSAILFWQPGDPLNHMVFIVLCGVSMAIGAAQSSIYLPQGLVALLYGVIACLMSVSEGGQIYYIFSALCLVAMSFVASIVLNLNRMGERMLTLSRDQAEMVQTLIKANAAKSEFLANMSHELRTPLNAIIGFSDVMRQELLGPIEPAAYRGYLSDIHFSGAHLLSLINDILDLSRIEAGKFELSEEILNLRELVEDTGRLVRVRAEGAGISIVNEVPAGVTIRADARAMRQVAVNLATNAIKFTPNGGVVRTSMSIDAAGNALVALSDTGRGIHPDDLERVFESFGQGRHDRADRDRGTGLGLPIVRGLIRAHGGEVTLSSQLGRGTTVTVMIPAHRVVSAIPEAA